MLVYFIFSQILEDYLHVEDAKHCSYENDYFLYCFSLHSLYMVCNCILENELIVLIAQCIWMFLDVMNLLKSSCFFYVSRVILSNMLSHLKGFYKPLGPHIIAWFYVAVLSEQLRWCGMCNFLYGPWGA